MKMNNYVFYIGFGLATCWLIYGIWKRPKCTKCNVYLKLLRSEDPFGINITNKIRLTVISGISRKEKNYYQCPKCGANIVIEEKIRG
jgi:ribosomal protein L37AE/L43A